MASWNTDRSLHVVCIVIGLLGLIPIFHDSNNQLRVLYVIALALLLVVFYVLYRSGRGPQYSTTMMRKHLRFLSDDGAKATFTREQTIRINYGSMNEIWCRNIVADGVIENVQVDGLVPSAEDQQRLGCLLDVRKVFTSTLYKGQAATVCWSHDLINSFPDRREFIDHDVTPATRLVELVVELPKGQRKFENPTLEERVAGEPSRGLVPPSIEQNGKILRAKIKSPHSGRTIRLSWEW